MRKEIRCIENTAGDIYALLDKVYKITLRLGDDLDYGEISHLIDYVTYFNVNTKHKELWDLLMKLESKYTNHE